MPSGKTFHQIAFATIAPYCQSDEWYMDYQWGGRFGRGFTLTVSGDGTIHEGAPLWVS
jgi:hypothetical protein